MKAMIRRKREREEDDDEMLKESSIQRAMNKNGNKVPVAAVNSRTALVVSLNANGLREKMVGKK